MSKFPYIFPPSHLLIIKYHQLSGMSTHFSTNLVVFPSK
nr:MAG TPA: hypothetical protein [Caudoviricetes sp.]